MAAELALTLMRLGCTNRPFFLIVVANRKSRRWLGDVVEQIGSFDPLPNKFNEKLVALDLDRTRYWLAQRVRISKSVLELLGLAGLLPAHPLTVLRARQNASNPLLLPHFRQQLVLPPQADDGEKAEQNASSVVDKG